MIKYLVFVTVAALMLAGFRIKGAFRWVSVAVGLAVIALVILFGTSLGVQERGAADGFWHSSWIAEGCLFLAMLAGMASRYIWDLIEVRRERRNQQGAGAPAAALNFDWLDFLQPLLVSGIVFGVVIGAGKEINVTSALFSYQNGFFWQSILKPRLETGRLKQPG